MEKKYLIFVLLFFTMQINHAQVVSRCNPLKIGIIADIQYCDCEDAATYNRFYRKSLDKLRACRDSFNQHDDLDFVIHLGDFIDRGWDNIDTVKNIYDSINTTRYHTLGNHDFDVADNYKSQVASKYGMPAPYYDFIYRNWRFIVLNTNDLSLKAYPKGSDDYKKSDTLYQKILDEGKPQAKDWNGGLGKEQLEWLRKKLDTSSNLNQNVILFAHMPLLPNTHYNLVWNNEEVLTVIENYNCVKGYLCGHHHSGERFLQNGIQHINFKGMLDYEDKTAYSIVTLTQDSIQVNGFGREKDTTYHFNVDSIKVCAIDLTAEQEAINQIAGTLQVQAQVLPEHATEKTIEWTVNDSTGKANITNEGLVTAISDGIVVVKAKATDGSETVGKFILQINNQNSVSQIENQQIITVYPNPTTQNVQIKFNEAISQKIQLKLTDLNGRTVIKRKITSPITEGFIYSIPLDKLNEGIYFLLIETNNKKIPATPIHYVK